MDTSSPETPAQRQRLPFSQARPAKIFHWVNLVSLFILLTSGLQIYNANPVFGGRGGLYIPPLFALGGWLAGGRNWHFAAMWVYSLNLLWYGLYILFSRRWQHRFVGIRDLKALLLGHNLKRKNYAWHRLVYTAIIPVLLLSIVSGLAMYKPAQFAWLSGLFGSWQTLRIVHFLTVPIVLIFAWLHSSLAVKVGTIRLIESMFE